MSTVKKKPLTSRQKTLKIADFIQAKKAKDIIALDIRKLSSLCDYFVICSAESQRQTNAICEQVIKECKKNEIDIQHYEKDEQSSWILVDLFDVIVHIFSSPAREFYRLEHLWKAARKLKIKKTKKMQKSIDILNKFDKVRLEGYSDKTSGIKKEVIDGYEEGSKEKEKIKPSR